MRQVLVTGGGSGIGRDIARHFAKEGDAVTIAGRRMDALQETAQGYDMRCLTADVTDEASVKSLFETPYDVVIANAGAAQWTMLEDMSLEEWNRIQSVTLAGVFLTFREGLRGMSAGGRLIAVASTASLQGGVGLAAYSAAKHGVLGLMRSTAKEVARRGITCNAVCPAFVETEMAEQAVQSLMVRLNCDHDIAVKAITSPNPMRRMIDPSEVTSAVAYLASPGASSVNGHALSISGGEI